MELTQDEIFRYSRHLIIPQVGLEGQRKLKSASVLLIGSGGLGSPISLYLAAAGVGHIGVVDYDSVESSNLQRQVIHDTQHLGMPKAESARDRMLAVNPFIQVDPIVENFTTENAIEISTGYDILVDGTDNFPTRYLINDLCVMTGRPYVYGSIFRFEGQISVFDARTGPCYRCLFPDPPEPGLIPSCAEGGVFGVLPGTVGTIQATEVIKLILGTGEPLVGKLLLYDALEMSFQTVQLRKNPHCVICGDTPSITKLIDYEEFCGTSSNIHHDKNQVGWDIEVRELEKRLRLGEKFRLIDVRDPVEQQVSMLEGAESIPLEKLSAHMSEFSQDENIVFFCRTGSRSLRALKMFRKAGFRNVKNLQGGLNTWAQMVDKSMFQY